MSTTYFSWTYPVDTSVAESGLQAVLDALKGPTAQDDFIHDASRSDWYLSTVEKMVRNTAPIALRFLDRAHGERVVDTSGQAWAVATLTVAALPAAIGAIDDLLRRARNDPRTMLTYFNAYGSTEDDIRQAIAYPREVDGDEGMGPGYFFEHLLDLRNLLARASDAKSGVAHIRYLYE